MICADSSSRKTAGIIVLWGARKPIIESGRHVALNPRAPEAIEAAVYEAVYDAAQAHVAEDFRLARNSILSIKPRIWSVLANQATGRDGIEGRAEAAKGAIHEHTARLR